MFARTPRLTLRPGWPEDAAALHRAIAHEAVAMKLGRLPWPYTLAHAEAWLGAAPAPGNHPLLILAHDRGVAPELIGCVGLHPDGEELELGYWLTPAAWGCGYATESGRAAIDMARHALGRERLVSGHFVDNPASGRVLAKLGFRPTGSEQRHCLARGEDVECLTFELDLVERPGSDGGVIFPLPFSREGEPRSGEGEGKCDAACESHCPSPPFASLTVPLP